MQKVFDSSLWFPETKNIFYRSGDQSEVKHLDWWPEEAVTEVHLRELVLEGNPCLGWSLRLHDGDAVKEG